jgi:5,10-methylenetetrahydromethanopterin reductase
VAATGPKVIELAAALAERITFSVGAAPDRVAWAIDHVRAARAGSGDPAGLSLGAYVNIAVHDDMDIERDLVSGGSRSLPGFSVMHGAVTGGATRQDASTLDALHGRYDMTKHGEGATGSWATISPVGTRLSGPRGSALRGSGSCASSA